jgi:hypothetical protein
MLNKTKPDKNKRWIQCIQQVFILLGLTSVEIKCVRVKKLPLTHSLLFILGLGMSNHLNKKQFKSY